LFRLDKYRAVSLVYFFVNSLFLPFGLLYTMLLTPFFYFWNVKQGSYRIITYFVLFLLPYFCIHVALGANLFYYVRSSVMLFATVVFGFTVYNFVKTKKIQNYFPLIIKVNFILFLIALALFFTPWAEYLWTIRNLTLEIKDFQRLELFTYEPSYYSFLLAPIAIYYILKLALYSSTYSKAFTYGIAIFLPLLFSFSLGVLSALFLAFVGLFLINIKSLYPKKKFFYSINSIVILTVFALLILLIVYPQNPLYARIEDMIEGKDLSAKGRTYYAMYLAGQIASEKSIWFGVGLGQVKVVGAEIIRKFYNYHVSDLASIRIPNTIAETFAMFGIVGLATRLGLQFFLFFKTKVYNNYYRTTVFLFVFIYQFTGSFFTNIVELVMWVIAFTPCCFLFDRKRFSSQKQLQDSSS